MGAESDKLAVPLKKRKVKIKLEDLEFDDDISKRRYKAHGISPFPVPINVGRDVYEVMVPRFFMSSVYGGNPVEVMPAISEEKFREHGFRNFFYAALDAHPQAPRIPGAPGLWFSAGDDHRILFDGLALGAGSGLNLTFIGADGLRRDECFGHSLTSNFCGGHDYCARTVDR